MREQGPIPFEGLELAWGYPLGYLDEDRGLQPPVSPLGARDALEKVVAQALRRPPCIVAFSGGRDSSAILAVATHLARRSGLPPPIPVTRRFSNANRADEREWQELVIRHLAVPDWVIEQVEDEMDVVGPLAQEQLRRHGVLWPPLLYGDEFFLKHAGGGSVLDGEGGDNVLGPESHRLAPVARVLRALRGRRNPRDHVAAGAVAIAPAQLRRQRARARVSHLPLPWLRPPARRALAEAYADHLAGQPLSMRRSLELIPRTRSVAIMAVNRRYLARLRDVDYVSPFLERSFVGALANEMPGLGPRHRAETLEKLVSDLLPSPLLRRRTKAEFSETVWHRHALAFAERWRGAGINPELVDQDLLRTLWRGSETNSLSAGLIQAAWLAEDAQGPPRHDPGTGT